MRSLSPPEQLAFLEDERTRLHEDAARSISPERRVLKSSLSQSASPDKIRFLEEERCRLERSLSRSASCDTAVEELEVERVQVQEEEATAAPVPPRIAVLVQATEINQGECFWCSLEARLRIVVSQIEEAMSELKSTNRTIQSTRIQIQSTKVEAIK